MLTIKNAHSSDLEAVTELYNLVTKKLIEQDVPQWDYPWTVQAIEKLLPQLVLLLKNKQIIGSMKITEIIRLNQYQFEQPVLFLEKIAIHPAEQGKGNLEVLFTYARQQGKRKQKQVYLDCWAGNQKLIAHYSQHCEQVLTLPEEKYEIAVFRLCQEKI